MCNCDELLCHLRIWGNYINVELLGALWYLSMKVTLNDATTEASASTQCKISFKQRKLRSLRVLTENTVSSNSTYIKKKVQSNLYEFNVYLKACDLLSHRYTPTENKSQPTITLQTLSYFLPLLCRCFTPRWNTRYDNFEAAHLLEVLFFLSLGLEAKLNKWTCCITLFVYFSLTIFTVTHMAMKSELLNTPF